MAFAVVRWTCPLPSSNVARVKDSLGFTPDDTQLLPRATLMHVTPSLLRLPYALRRPLSVAAGALLAFGLASCGSDSDGPSPSLPSSPVVTVTVPSDAATDVAINTKLVVSFDRAMEPLTAAAFTLKQGTTPIPGAITNTSDGMTATFHPSSNLAVTTQFTATIVKGAKAAAGGALQEETSWTFTTGNTADTTAPEVSDRSPAPGSSGAATNARIVAAFNEPMDPLTVTASTFTLKQGLTPVDGTVTYGPGTLATFSPAGILTASTEFTASLSPEAKDLGGNGLSSAVSWSFTTGTSTAKGPAAVGLGTAANYVVLAKAAISTVPPSVLTGNIGVSPAAASFITGFDLVAATGYSTSPQVVGQVFAANYAVPTPSNLTTAVSNMQSAYTDAANRPTPDFLELGTGNIGGKTLAPGLYKWTSSVTIPTNVTISGGANDVWIFQTTGDLSSSSATRVNLEGGALAKNIFWQVAGKVTLGARSHFEGILLCKTEVTLETEATMNGRVLAQTQVALQKATVTKP
ncbi:MAG TPA: ice-binding family protein [Myxococcaceae bacterium]|nr:ice-binding family protein [Myxococcaceae bacterium]